MTKSEQDKMEAALKPFEFLYKAMADKRSQIIEEDGDPGQLYQFDQAFDLVAGAYWALECMHDLRWG